LKTRGSLFAVDEYLIGHGPILYASVARAHQIYQMS